MSSAFIVLTTDCARQCAWCCNTFTPPRAGDRLRGSAPQALDRLQQLGIRHLIITGGEPAVVPELTEWLHGAAARGMSTLLLTAAPLTALRVREWRAAGLSALTCSLPEAVIPGVVPDAVTEQARRQLAAARDGELDAVTLLACVTRDNLAVISALDTLADEQECPLLLQPLVVPVDHADYPRTLAGLQGEAWERLDDVLRPWAEKQKCNGYLQLWLDLYLELGNSPVSCFMGSDALVVDPDGSVFACFHRRDKSCGNLLDDDPQGVLLHLFAVNDEVIDAPCFGRHCLSLFTGAGGA